MMRFGGKSELLITTEIGLNISRHVRSPMPKVFEPAAHLCNPTLPERRSSGPCQAVLVPNLLIENCLLNRASYLLEMDHQSQTVAERCDSCLMGRPGKNLKNR
ncbi:hypothetical protein RRG08_063222 [Elysia crispata]|uniref:Uncharacterized protein n=1 Tax=Elysia crispata TaxID=231223 RepID=A0AAE0Y9F2_9GAST|nr:hypothetical protein RRG08_063222 [Elysia crispata]